MRLTATNIAIPAITFLSLLLSGCSPQPTNLKKELEAINGPQPEGMGGALKTQADQAVVKGDFNRAAQNYKQLSDKEPANRDYSLALADSLRRAGSYQDALQVLDKYLAQNPDDAAAFENKGLCQMNLGNFQDAGGAFEQVMKIEPTRWRTLNAVGILFSMKGKFKEAIEYYDEALVNNPDNASVLNNRGLSLAMDGRYDEATESFLRTKKSLREGTPDMKQVDMNLALVYAIAGRLDDAEHVASKYLSKAALYNNMGVYADLAKSPELAKSYLNMALTQSPVYYERAWKNLGVVNDEQNGSTKTPQPKAIMIPEAKKVEAEPKKEEANMIPPVTVQSDASPAAGVTSVPVEKKLSDIPSPDAASGGFVLMPAAEVPPAE